MANAAEFANMSALLARGTDFNRKEIVVTGYRCKKADSKDGLFLSPSDCEFSNNENAVRVSFDSRMKAPKHGLIRVRGLFIYDANVIKTDDPYRWGELQVIEVY